jgi:ribosomal-protein-alanine N-acetyltransferase
MPNLETERLLLRPPNSGDAPAIAEALGNFAVARNLAAVPHPFSLLDAEAFVAERVAVQAKGEAFTFALVRKDRPRTMGCCTLNLADSTYKLGYWLGRPFWHQGYASEAARKVLSFAFHDLKVDRVFAGWFADNPASGRVLEKLGFEPVETYRRACLARGGFVICNRTVLLREKFGRHRLRLDQPDWPQAVGA